MLTGKYASSTGVVVNELRVNPNQDTFAHVLKGAGYQVIDLGTDVSADRITAAVKESQASFLGLSALLTTTMRVMGEVVQKLKEEGIRDRVKVLIGGAPTSIKFAREIGADAYCKDAFQALEILKK